MKVIMIRYKWVLLVLLILAIAVVFSSHYSRYDMDARKIVEHALRNEKKLKSYYGSLEVNPENSYAAQRYFMQIWYLAPASYRVEVFTSYLSDEPPAQLLISDGESRWLHSPELGDYYHISPLPDSKTSLPPFLLNYFLQEIDQAREVELIGIEKDDHGTYYLLHVIPQGMTRGHAWEKIWLEKRSLLPVKVQVFDEQDRLERTITYKKLELNPGLNIELFQIPEQ